MSLGKLASGASAMQASYVAESCDGMALHLFAKRVPRAKAKGTGKKKLDATAMGSQYRAQVKMVDLAMKYPSIAVDAFSAIEPLLAKHRQAQDDKRDTFSEQYKKFWRIPATWKAPWVTKWSEGAISADYFSILVTKHGGKQDVIHAVFYYITRTGPQMHLVDTCQSKRVFSLALMQYAEPCTGRIAKVADSLKKHGDVLFDADCCPYSITFDERGLATKIVYDNGDEAAVDAGETFSRKYKLYDCHLDHGAFVEAPKTKRQVFLKDFFDPGAGPHRIYSSFSECAAAAEAEVKAMYNRIASGIIEDQETVAQASEELKRTLARNRGLKMVEARKKARLDRGATMEEPSVKAKTLPVKASDSKSDS